MQAAGDGYYTIGSSGHEGMAAVASALRPSDMAFLHYRDGAFQTRRSAQVPGTTPTWDMLLSFATATDDPLSGGRHKVLGSKAMRHPTANYPPSPATCPRRWGLPTVLGWRSDSRARAQGARGRRHRHVFLLGMRPQTIPPLRARSMRPVGLRSNRCPLRFAVFVCEDNGIGISTRTPKGWVAANYSAKPGLKYFYADGPGLFLTPIALPGRQPTIVRTRRKPAFLHLSLVRLYGHAGSDMQQVYLPRETFEAWEDDDPMLHSARLLIDRGVLSAEDVTSIYDEVEAQCARIAQQVVTRPRLKDAKGVMASIIPPARECAVRSAPLCRRAGGGVCARICGRWKNRSPCHVC